MQIDQVLVSVLDILYDAKTEAVSEYAKSRNIATNNIEGRRQAAEEWFAHQVGAGAVKDSLTQAGVEGLTISPDFLEAVERLPRCSGVSVGMDRLLMLCLGKENISEVVFSFQKESGARRKESE